MSRVPLIYARAEVAVVTPCDGEYIGLGFGHSAGVSRFCLTKEAALQLAELIRSHCETCAGMPNREVSSSLPVEE